MKEFSNKQITSIVNNKIAKIFLVRCNLHTKSLTGKFVGFSGIKTLIRFNLKTDTKIKLNFDVKSGWANLVLVDKNKHIINLAQNSQNQEVKILSGKYRLRIYGENFDGELLITKAN